MSKYDNLCKGDDYRLQRVAYATLAMTKCVATQNLITLKSVIMMAKSESIQKAHFAKFCKIM
ncbi:hypothetical protein [Helicobacter sp. T3_23-1056]